MMGEATVTGTYADIYSAGWVKGGSKRRQRPTTLTVDEFELILATLKEPYRAMVYIAQCLGFRVSEIAALQWDDFDFKKNQLLVQRSFVSGRVDDVKTEYSQDYVPLHPLLTEIVLEWSKEAVRRKKAGLCQSSNGATVSSHGDSKAASTPFGMLRGGVPEVRCGSRCLVLARSSDTERGPVTDSRRAQGCGRKVRRNRLAHLPPHVPAG